MKVPAILALLGIALLSACRGDPQPGRITLYVLPVGEAADLPSGAEEITVARVELVYEPEARQKGLKYRRTLEPDTGMLFVYPEQRDLGFWMKDTVIPLSIAYADASGRIVRIREMEPDPGDGRVLPRYPSDAPALYALEMEKGWFERKGVREGDQMLFHPAILALDPR